MVVLYQWGSETGKYRIKQDKVNFPPEKIIKLIFGKKGAHRSEAGFQLFAIPDTSDLYR